MKALIESDCRVDLTKVVATGGSRGGTTALRTASHPNPNYTVYFAIARNPMTKPAGLFELFGTLTIRRVVSIFSDLTGYWSAFEKHGFSDLNTALNPTWVDPPAAHFRRPRVERCASDCSGRDSRPPTRLVPYLTPLHLRGPSEHLAPFTCRVHRSEGL